VPSTSEAQMRTLLAAIRETSRDTALAVDELP
jgi:hypothetical protein